MDKKTMINPSIKELLDKVDNRYRLVTVTSRRARQLVAHQPSLLENSNPDKALATAIEELYDGLITYETIDPVK